MSISATVPPNYTTVPSAQVDFTGLSNTYTAPMDMNVHEPVERIEFGDDKEKCGACPKALECASGMLHKTQYVAKSREEHKNGYALPCIDDGAVKLAVMSELEVAAAEYKIAQLRQYLMPRASTPLQGIYTYPKGTPPPAVTATTVTFGPYSDVTSGTVYLR